MIYTAIFGGRDTLKDPKIRTPGARYVCFTDEPLRSDVWEIVRAPVEDGSPRRTSRTYKLLPHRYFETEYSLWVDASFCINVDVRTLMECYLARADLALFNNPVADCVYELSERLIQIRLDSPDRIRSQIQRYRSEGLPERGGVLHGAVLLRRHTPEIARFNEAWWDEYQRGSVRDVLSLRYCSWRLGIPVGIIEGHVLKSPAVEFLDHRSQRLRSEFVQDEWERLPPPEVVAAFPADLDNTALEYAGVYADGWLARSAFLGLRQPDGSSALTVSMMVPGIDDPAFTTELRVLVDGAEVAQHRLGLGESRLQILVPPGAGRRRVDLHFSADQPLPEPIPRRVAALAQRIGFEGSSAPATATP